MEAKEHLDRENQAMLKSLGGTPPSSTGCPAKKRFRFFKKRGVCGKSADNKGTLLLGESVRLD